MIYKKVRTDDVLYKDITDESYALSESTTNIKIYLFGIKFSDVTHTIINNSTYKFKVDLQKKPIGLGR